MTLIRKNLYLCCFFMLLFLAGCTVDETDEKDKIHRNDLPLGASAKDFLSDEVFTSLDVEIVYVTGYAPTQETLSNLKTFLGKYLHKPNGISIKTRAIGAPGMGTYSLSELKTLEKQNRTVFSLGEKLGTYIFFADEKSDDSSQDRKVIGKAYMNTSMVIFDKEIQGMTGSGTQGEIQSTALHHEFGHLFGLVNNGSPAQSPHEETDEKKKAHCNVGGCLMAAAIEFSSSPLDLIDEGQNIPDFDDQCKLDLKANGGK